MAEAHCRELGGHLVSVHSPEEHRFIADLGHVFDEDPVWMGGTDLVENKWKYNEIISKEKNHLFCIFRK